MNYQLIIQNKTTSIAKNYAPLTSSVSHTTNRNGAAGKLTFTLLKGASVHFVEGDIVTFTVDSNKIFAGFVFSKSQNKLGIMEVTAYDQLRYLKASESYAFQAASITDIIKRIANDFQLTVGELQDPGYLIPVLIKENKECFDIINAALELTIYNTGKIWVFFDDAGKLALKEAGTMMVPTVLGSKSLIIDFNYKSDIDKETYNKIKLVRPNEETGRTDVYIYQDSNTIGSWGVLQYYEQVDEEMNAAQISEQGNIMLDYYNRVLRTLTIESLGIVGLRAGMMVMVKIPGLSDISISKFLLIEKVTHTFTNELHTMSLETKELLK